MTAALFAARMGGFAPGMFVFGILVPLVIIGLVAYGVYELVRARNLGAPAPAVAGGAASARTLLDERFARGEIDAEEYVQRRTLLDGTAAPVAPTAPPADEPAVEASPDVTTEQAATDPPA